MLEFLTGINFSCVLPASYLIKDDMALSAAVEQALDLNSATICENMQLSDIKHKTFSNWNDTVLIGIDYEMRK